METRLVSIALVNVITAIQIYVSRTRSSGKQTSGIGNTENQWKSDRQIQKKKISTTRVYFELAGNDGQQCQNNHDISQL